MQFQAQNFDFIAKAGEQVSQGMKAIDIAHKMKLDDTKAQQAHQLLLDQAKTEYKKATGIEDDVKATAFAAKYFPEKFQGESAVEAVNRWEKADPMFKSALSTLKVEAYHKQVAGGQAVPQGTQAPGGTMTMKQESTPEQARSARLEGQMTPTTEMASPGGFGYGELPGDRPESAQTPPMSAQDRYNLAQKQGILKDETVYADVAKTGREELAGTQFPQGTTSSDVYQKEMQQPVLDKMGQELHTQFPSQKDVMTNNRLTEAEKQRNKLREVLGKMRERRTAAHDLKGDDLKLLNTQINAVEAQISASENKTKLALGLSTGKDVLGQSTYSTGEEWKREYDDAETTYESANALMERIGRLNAAKNPDPNPPKQIPPAKSQFKIVKVQ